MIHRIPHFNVDFYKYNVKSGSTARFFTDKDYKFFLKAVFKYKEHFVVQREVFFLKLFNKQGFKWCPKLIHYDDTNIVTEYVGEEVNTNNIPDDYINQYYQILKDLDSLNIRHNDIKHTSILVHNKQLFIVDYGWTSVGDDFTCEGTIALQCDRPKLFTHDTHLEGLVILNKINELRPSNLKTVNTRRKGRGSQSDQPQFAINQDKIITIKGYQHYQINLDSVCILTKQNKYQKIDEILKELFCNGAKTIVDIGGSNGLVSVLACKLGYTDIYSLDHDIDCLNVIREITKQSVFKSITPQLFTFGQSIPSSDVLVMLAIIHWVFSCTSLYGNFKDIFLYIKRFIKKSLIIEWVDPQDTAIKKFKHIEFNSTIITEEYTRQNFENALTAYIGEITIITKITPTRFLYVVNI